jgi:hypothetical protein
MPVISIDPSTRDVTVAPTVAHVRPGALIRWEAPPGTSLLIVFDDARAVGESELRPSPDAAAQNVVERTAGTTNGTYHYKVVVAQRSNIFGIFGSPTIIIQ